MSEKNQTFNKGLIIVELLQYHQQLHLAELAALTSMSKQSLLRCLSTLIDRGWVRKRVNDWRYIWIGLPGSADVKTHEIWAGKSMPIIQNMKLEKGIACDLALLNEMGDLTLVDSTRLRGSEGVNGYVAGYQPSLVMTALGRAYLFACTNSLFEKKYKQACHHGDLAERNFVQQARWKQESERINKHGYTIREVDDYISQLVTESFPSVAMAVPIKNETGSIGAINVVWQSQTFSNEQIVETYLKPLKNTAKAISHTVSK